MFFNFCIYYFYIPVRLVRFKDEIDGFILFIIFESILFYTSSQYLYFTLLLQIYHLINFYKFIKKLILLLYITRCRLYRHLVLALNHLFFNLNKVSTFDLKELNFMLIFINLLFGISQGSFT